MDTYHILRVDLTSRTCVREAVPEELILSFLGGKGLAAHYLATEMPPGADPLGPDNLLIFMTGPLSGLFPGTTRHAVVTKSPATGGFLDTYAGGYFAWELRKAGLLGIIIRGTADSLCYLDVTAEAAEVKDAALLAGFSVDAVDDHPLFAGHRVAAIGPAGENRVAMAAIGNNAGHTKNGRSGYNGRGGAGAVMGAKNLKCIAVKGDRGPSTNEAVRELRRRLAHRIMQPGSPPSWLFDAGTPVIVDWSDGVQVLPVRNWRAGSMEDAAEHIGHEAVLAGLVARVGCYNCPVNCGMHVRAADGAFPGAESGKLEYETIGLAASNTDNTDFSSIVRFSEQCDRLGLDTISTGAVIAFAMDCAQSGIIDDPLRFGDSEGQARLTEDIAYRRGLGASLADGMRAAAERWSVDDSQIAVCEIKGLEFPAYDPRGSVGMGLAYATSDRGACHMRSWPIAAEALSDDPAADAFGSAGKAAFVIDEQDENTREWSLVGCDFIAYDADDALAMLGAVGLPLDADGYRRLGPRVWNLVRLFNLREGWTADDDRLPAVMHRPLEDSGRALAAEVFEEMKTEYYALRRWDALGRPRPELIRELGIESYV